MIYFFQSLVLGLVFMAFPMLIAYILEIRIDSKKRYEIKERRKLFFWLGCVATISYILLSWFIQWKFAVGVYGPTPFFCQIIVASFITLAICANLEFIVGIAVSLVIIAGYLSYALIVPVFCASDIFQAMDKAKLLEFQEISDFSEVMYPASTSTICQVDRKMARNSANIALSELKLEGGVVAGSRYTISDNPTKCWVDGQLWWIFSLKFQGWLKWRQNKEIPAYIRVSAQNPFEMAQAVITNKENKPFHIKYLLSACFEYQAERYLRYNGYLRAILADWTFEVDDEWNPYYTVSVLKRNYGFSGYSVIGLLILDVQTGKFQFQEDDQLDSWVDRKIPLEVIDYAAGKWGLYRLAGWWYNFLHDDKSMEPTPGWYMTYHPEIGCQWFTGWTSTNPNTSDLIGFSVTSARTGKTIYYNSKGVTENKARETARSLWSDFRYEPTEDLVPYNIYGHITYVIPMEVNNQFKGISLVSALNFNINAKGENLEQAFSNYRASLSKARSDQLAPSGGQLITQTIKGIIDRVGQPILQGNQQVFPFTIKGWSKIFLAVFSYSSPKAPFLVPGEEVVISFVDTKEKIITCESYDLPGFLLFDESPAQSEYKEEQLEFKKERDRVSDQLKKLP